MGHDADPGVLERDELTLEIGDEVVGRGLAQGFDDMMKVPGYAFAVLDVEPLGRRPSSPPLDAPEVKFRFGRYLERTGGRPVFDAPLRRT